MHHVASLVPSQLSHQCRNSPVFHAYMPTIWHVLCVQKKCEVRFLFCAILKKKCRYCEWIQSSAIGEYKHLFPKYNGVTTCETRDRSSHVQGGRGVRQCFHDQEEILWRVPERVCSSNCLSNTRTSNFTPERSVFITLVTCGILQSESHAFRIDLLFYDEAHLKWAGRTSCQNIHAWSHPIVNISLNQNSNIAFRWKCNVVLSSGLFLTDSCLTANYQPHLRQDAL